MAYKGETTESQFRAQKLCESRCGRPELAVHNSYSPYGLYGRIATLTVNTIIYIWLCARGSFKIYSGPDLKKK